MKYLRRLLPIIVIISTFFCFQGLAMNNNDEYIPPTPATEKNENHRWTWLSDEACVQFRALDHVLREILILKADSGLIRYWGETVNGQRQIKTRDTYTGTWSQDEFGIWSFVFDDFTIPVGLTKIDGVLYAFTGYGELKEGYKYWNGQQTGSDGVVTENSLEFLEYLETQYLPECTTQKTE